MKEGGRWTWSEALLAPKSDFLLSYGAGPGQTSLSEWTEVCGGVRGWEGEGELNAPGVLDAAGNKNNIIRYRIVLRSNHQPSGVKE